MSNIHLGGNVETRIGSAGTESVGWRHQRATANSCFVLIGIAILIFVCSPQSRSLAADGVWARSDGDARFLHHIDLYDIDNRKITPASTRPYSPRNTCGRCHDYDTISHGWHFNAFDADADSGRVGEPWIWTDARTGTQLPLTYRDWTSGFDARKIGISDWEMARHFGGRMPGGGFGETDSEEARASNRWPLSGSLEIDCLACHADEGVYDLNERRDQVAAENFSWAPTAAMRWGQIDGTVSQIKNGSDVNDETVRAKLPTVTYDERTFLPDGTVFVDLVREPTNNACLQCHSQRVVDKGGILPRWIHDEDIHLQAGMDCVDCHRNGIDHDIVRGFERPSASPTMRTLTCAGCHLGNDAMKDSAFDPAVAVGDRPGRLGSPQPMHEGLPPVHFEKLSCTACHAGPVPRAEALQFMTSLAHSLGSKGHRSGQELPNLAAPIFMKADDGRVHPHKVMWPAYWGIMTEDGSIKPIPPDRVQELTRRALRVRKDFVNEILLPKLKSVDLKDALGEDRAMVDDENRTDAERALVAEKRNELGRALFEEKVAAALTALEQELGVTTAVYVSSGIVHARGDVNDSLREVEPDEEMSAGLIAWPMAHNVRPAGWSLGTGGCLECHSESGMLFTSTVTPLGPVPPSLPPITMASLQGVDHWERQAWNQMFNGRGAFKVIVATSLTVVLVVLLMGLGRLGQRTAADPTRPDDATPTPEPENTLETTS